MRFSRTFVSGAQTEKPFLDFITPDSALTPERFLGKLSTNILIAAFAYPRCTATVIDAGPLTNDKHTEKINKHTKTCTSM